MNRSVIFADVSLLLVAFVWGTTFVLVQNAIAFLEPFSFNGVRFFMAAFLLGGWLVIFEREQLKKINKKLLISGIIMGLFLFIGYAFQTIGLLHTTSSKAGFITGLSVVMVPVFSFMLLKIKPGFNAIIGVSIATAGLYLLTMTDKVSLNIGDAYVLICAVGFALHIIFTGKYSSKYPALLLTVIQVGTVALLSGIFAFFTENWQQAFETGVLFKTNVVTALIVTSLFATALAFFAQTAFQKFTTPTRVALIFAMEPVFAAAAGFMWANERLSFSALTGCLLIFAGMVFAEIPAKKTLSIFRRKTA
ncbi:MULTISPECIES: DMT family transporter [Cytobacillus]|jgi:drug/metabolite transporter (DMT)-like permease|uniref:DMT family transporter n=1 Tax=Cytobacillus TaxID=2675230 RepID=UPI00203BED1B|nr:DMT family transporter [Cytobacillus oceanisediminis]MCM3243512.1 DMT family transporter [Cytobacillus oceanisediminis]MCM3401776.1 DMT family transporter [Cytobacillus oceanisediminis]MCS0827085.1 DMT family transporter [Cytobacillus firmus]MDK7664669.1 DMT family transporter [Cytobacillus oceanisediminis]